MMSNTGPLSGVGNGVQTPDGCGSGTLTTHVPEPPSTQKFSTVSGSRYEMTSDSIRRLSGTHAPTQRQGTDGEWREYVDCSEVIVGLPVFIHWGDGRFTVTTAVTEMT